MSGVPVAYTRDELALFMLQTIGPAAKVLEWDTVASYDETVNDTLIAYGVDAIAEATNIPLLRAYARREVWRAVMDAVAIAYDIRTPDGEQLSRSQMYAHAQEQYDRAAATVATMTLVDDPDEAHMVRRYSVVRSPDPYTRG